MILHYKAEKNPEARTHGNSSSSWDWGVWHRPLVQVVTWWGWYDCWSLDWGSWRASGLTTGLAGLDLRSCEHSGEVSSVCLVCQHWNPISRQPKTLWWNVICLLWLEGLMETLLCSVSVCLVRCYKPTVMCKQKWLDLKSLQNLASSLCCQSGTRGHSWMWASLLTLFSYEDRVSLRDWWLSHINIGLLLITVLPSDLGLFPEDD